MSSVVEVMAPVSPPPDALTLTGEALLRATIEAYGIFRQSGWRWVYLLTRVQRTRAFAPSYASLEQWAAQALGLHGRSSLYRFLQLGRATEKLDEPLRVRLESRPVWTAIEVLPLLPLCPARAVELAVTSGHAMAVRNAVRRELDRPPMDDCSTRWRWIEMSVPEEVFALWQRAVNTARFYADLRDLTHPGLVECLALSFLEDPNVLPPDLPAAVRQQIEEGRWRCGEVTRGTPTRARRHGPVGCGSYQRSDLEQHHVLPRSKGGHEGPLVLLCSHCHGRVTRRVRGYGWRELAEDLGFPDLAAYWGTDATGVVARVVGHDDNTNTAACIADGS